MPTAPRLLQNSSFFLWELMYPRLASNLLCSHIAMKPRMILNFLVALLTLYQLHPISTSGNPGIQPMF